MTRKTKEEILADNALIEAGEKTVAAFQEELLLLCYKYGVYCEASEGTDIYVLRGSSKPALESNFEFNYVGVK